MNAPFRPPRPLRHFLISIYVPPCHMHSYLMQPSDDTRGEISKMLDAVEKAGARVWPPMVLVTHLNSDGCAEVRKIVSENEECKRLLAEATDYQAPDQTIDRVRDLARACRRA